MGKKKPDIDAKAASKMSPKKILAEIRKGKTVSGYSDYLEEHFGVDLVKDVSVKDIEKVEKKMGSVWHEGTITTRRGGGIADTARELFGSKGKPPPNGRKSWW
jgi:hypothetical protein